MADQAGAANQAVNRPPSPGTRSARGEIRIEEPSRAERTLVRRVAESRATVPDLELSAEVEMVQAVEQCTCDDALLTALLVKACAVALHEHPRANGCYRDGRFELYSRVNVGVAVSTEDAQVYPTVFDADSKSVAELQADIRASARRAHGGELTPPELSGATFTLWSASSPCVARMAPIIIPPHAAAVGAGVVREAAIVRGGQIVTGHVMTVTLACDHRILYGAHATSFLSRIKELLEQPRSL